MLTVEVTSLNPPKSLTTLVCDDRMTQYQMVCHHVKTNQGVAWYMSIYGVNKHLATMPANWIMI